MRKVHLEKATTRRLKGRAAFTLIELLISIGIIGLIVGILIPTVTRVRATQRTANCTSNLRQIVTAFHLYAQDNQARLPDPSKADLSWEQMLTPYTRGNFACPSDFELSQVVGSSYDWRDTGNKLTTMAGRSIAETARPGAVFVFEALPGWHSRGMLNVARLDSSVAAVDEDECFADLRAPLIGAPPVRTR